LYGFGMDDVLAQWAERHVPALADALVDTRTRGLALRPLR
jgi:hypothetical protein